MALSQDVFNRHPVAVADFVEAMSRRWADLGNVLADGLPEVWSQLCRVLNQKAHAVGLDQRWKAFSAELGAGKTSGLCLWLALLSKNTGSKNPGSLVIVRLRAQADDVAASVNELAGAEIAIAYHGKNHLDQDGNKVKPNELVRFPVVVATHAAFQRGLEALRKNEAESEGLARWNHLHAWHGSDSDDERRACVVVDEALDLIREDRATLNNLRYLRGVIPTDIALRHPALIAALDKTIAALTAFAAKKNKRRTAQPIAREDLPPLVDFAPLWDDLRVNTRWSSHLVFGDSSVAGSAEKARQRFLRRLEYALSGLQALLTQWHWSYNALGDYTLATSSLLIPDEGIRGPIVLDATAKVNRIYELLPFVDIVPVPSARDYNPCLLRYVVTRYTGKDRLNKEEGLADHVVREMVANLQLHYGREGSSYRSVLFVGHQFLGPVVTKWATDAGFKQWDFGHWNALDGRNDWSEFDTIVILTQPYLDSETPAAVYQAVNGPQTTQWLRDEKLREWKNPRDGKKIGEVLKVLEMSHLVVANAQAVGRIRCRRVIDTQGRCKPADIFMRLRSNGLLALLAGIKTVMPGLRTEEWKSYRPIESDTNQQDTKSAAVAKRAKALQPSHEQALVAYCETLLPNGYTEYRLVGEKLGITSRWLETFAARLNDATDSLAARLAEIGVTYEVVPVGRVRRAYLNKVRPEKFASDSYDAMRSEQEASMTDEERFNALFEPVTSEEDSL